MRTYPRAADVYQWRIHEGDPSATTILSCIIAWFSHLPGEYHKTVTLKDVFPFVPAMEAIPIVLSYHQYKLTVGELGGKRFQGVDHIVRLWQTELHIRYLHRLYITNCRPCKFEAETIVPQAAVLQRILWADHQPHLVHQTLAYYFPSHGGVTKVYRIETSPIHSGYCLFWRLLAHFEDKVSLFCRIFAIFADKFYII